MTWAGIAWETPRRRSGRISRNAERFILDQSRYQIPRADIAQRLTLLGLAIALQNLLEAPRRMLLGVFGERLTGLVIVGALRSVALPDFPRDPAGGAEMALAGEPVASRWLCLSLTLVAALFGLKSLASIAVAGFNAPYYPNDGTTLDHYAAQELLKGHNPYVTTDIVAAIHEFQQDPVRTTPLARGAFAALPPGQYPSQDLIRRFLHSSLWDSRRTSSSSRRMSAIRR